MDSQHVLRKVITDFVILSVVAFPILIFRLFVTPVTRGFFCNDETIRYPFKPSTVPNIALYVVGLGLPISVMTACEIILASRNTSPSSPLYLFGRKIPLWMINWYKTVGVFCFGAVCSQMITDVGKYSIGRLRPHFYDVCKPNINCNLPIYNYSYITDYECLGTSSKNLREARLSFPSGHSSFAAYTMIYLAFYIQARVSWRGSYLLKHAAQLICLLICWATALSRVNDNKHHWSDVTVGLLIGSITAVITFKVVKKGDVTDIYTGHAKEKTYLLSNDPQSGHTSQHMASIRSRGSRGQLNSSVMWA